jgi:uncharacterized repeat protein (TIGR01451 family)
MECRQKMPGKSSTLVLPIATGLISLQLALPAIAVQCPDGILPGDCVAKDLQPTGTEVLNGPSACTIGETISLDLRVKFENGGGANTRYSVGFFVGDNGEPPLGGSSCTFDSLQPVGPPIDLTGGSGGFENLNPGPNDFCGDISKDDPTYKDIALTQVLCKDDDGDGQVDIGYVLSWANNGNQEQCLDPLDPLEFYPDPPKCQAELEYDLPIDVELPPSISVGKGVSPSTVREPGGPIDISFTIINTSPDITDPVTITSIVDVPLGDLSNATSCTLPFTLARGQSAVCTYSTTVSGVEGDVLPDTVTVTGEDDEGNQVTAVDTASVEIIGGVTPPQPGDLRLQKTAVPNQVFEPGGNVTYRVLLDNVSETGLVVSSLIDDIYGDLNGRGTCQTPIVLAGENTLYMCSFTESVTGQPGDVITDVITATASDQLPAKTALTASDDASVTIVDLQSDLEVTKIPSPATVLEPGRNVTFTLFIQNKSAADTIAVDSVVDSITGDVSSICGVPFTLAPGEIQTCSYVDSVTGNAGDFVTNVVEVTGIDDDGAPNFDSTAATVTIVGALPSITVRKLALPPVALETGSDVTYVVSIHNTSSSTDPVTIDTIVDQLAANAGGTVRDLEPECGPLPLVLPADARHICSFTATVDGTMTTPANSDLVDTVTVSGFDDDAFPVSGEDSATVVFVNPIPVQPELIVSKTASPVEVVEPGGNVTYALIVANAGPAGAATLTITDLNDSPYGSLNAAADCGAIIGTALAVGETASCSFVRLASGAVDQVITDTVTATATYFAGAATLTAQASASVLITGLPASLSVVKTASPVALLEPGGDVTFEFTIDNTSLRDSIELRSVIDSIYGDIEGRGDCSFNRTLIAQESYSCSFIANVSGSGGTQELNTVVVIGEDDDGNEVQASDQASVSIIDQAAQIAASKQASPPSLPEGGGAVNFTFSVENTSVADSLTVNTLYDDVLGDLNGQGSCSVPQPLAPGDSYSCAVTETLAGSAGDTHLNELSVTGVSDAGDQVSATASAVVQFLGVLRAVPGIGGIGLAVLCLALLGLVRRYYLKR